MNARSLLVALVATAPALVAQGFVDITTTAGLDLPLEPAGFFGRGLCAGDFDGDGDQDLIVPHGATSPLRYFENDGTGRFTERSAASNLGIGGHIRCITAADVDNDGDLDVYVGREMEPNRLFINDGTGRFVDEASQRGVDYSNYTYSAAFGDYDRDGNLDLYLGIHDFTLPNRMYHNSGDGFFTDVTSPDRANSLGLTFIGIFIDFDEDGWLDVLIVQDKGDRYGPNELHRNNRDGTFTDVSAAMNAGIAIDGMGVDFVDAFNDGGVDFYASDTQPDHLFEVWDPSVGRYIEAQNLYGVVGGYVGWCCNFVDYDNDGWQDIHVVHLRGPNHMYRNPAAPAAAFAQWPEVGQALGLDHGGDQFSVLVVDIDDDGRLDLVQVFDGTAAPSGQLMVQHNRVPAGNWLKIRTAGTVGNRDGIGARIAVTTPATTQRQWVRSGIGFLSSCDLRVNFGLGTATSADRVEITWPLGQVQYFTDVAANQILVATEPSFRHEGTAQPGSTTTLRLSSPADGGLGYAVPLSLSPAPPLVLSDGREIPIHLDALSVLTLTPGNAIVPDSVGALPASGAVDCALHIPNIPALSGLTLYGTAVTFDAGFVNGIRTILPRVEITIQ